MQPDPILPRPRLSAAKNLLESAGLPTEDLTERHCENFFYTGSAESPSGLVGLEIFGDVALLRSLVVTAQRQGTGAGSALLVHAETAARAAGVAAIYLLTTTAQSFFEKRGYGHAVREAAPEAIRSTREFAGICPASSAFMMRTLGAAG
jgi:amino-acid N-acetyltransferase